MIAFDQLQVDLVAFRGESSEHLRNDIGAESMEGAEIDRLDIGCLAAAGIVDARRRAVSAIGIDERRSMIECEDLLDTADDHMMRADFLRRQYPAIERRQDIGDARCTGCERCPAGAGEFVAVRRPGATGEAIGDERLVVAQDIHAEDPVGDDRLRRRA